MVNNNNNNKKKHENPAPRKTTSEMSASSTNPIVIIQARVATSHGASQFDAGIVAQYHERFRGDPFTPSHVAETLRLVRYNLRKLEIQATNGVVNHQRSAGTMKGPPESAERKERGEALLMILEEAAGRARRFESFLDESESVINCLTYPIAYPNMEAVINLSIYPNLSMEEQEESGVKIEIEEEVAEEETGGGDIDPPHVEASEMACSELVCCQYTRKGRCDFGDRCKFDHSVVYGRVPRGVKHPLPPGVRCHRLVRGHSVKYPCPRHTYTPY